MKFTKRGRWADGTEGHLTWEDGKISGHPDFVEQAKLTAEWIESGKLNGLLFGHMTISKDLLTNPLYFWVLCDHVIRDDPFNGGELLEVTGDVPDFPPDGLIPR